MTKEKPAEHSDIEADRVVSQKLDTEWWDKQAEEDYRIRWLDELPDEEAPPNDV